MKKNLSHSSSLKLIKTLSVSALFFNSFNIFAQQADSVIFKDSFNRASLGSFWQAAPSWSVIDGAAYNFIDGSGGYLRTAKSYTEASYVIETTARGFTDNYAREFRITFGHADLLNDSTYVLSYKPHNGGRFELSRSADDIYNAHTLDEAVIYPQLLAGKSYRFKIARYKSGLIQVYVNKGDGYGSTPFLEAIDLTYTNAGHIGWQVDTQSFAENFFVDDITTVKPALEKPAVREKPAEDNLITQVSAKSGKQYNVAKLDTGMKEYTDRDYTIRYVPPYLNGASFIQTANDDKKNVSDTFLTFFIKKDAIVYVGYDAESKTVPAWLGSFTKTGDYIGTAGSKLPYFSVYSKLVESPQVYPNPFLIGANLARPGFGAENNYIVAAVERPVLLPLQAEDAFVSGAVSAANHPGYNGKGFVDFINASDDFIEWTVKTDVPGTYNISFAYANGSDKNRPLQVKLDGAAIAAIPFFPTSSWSSWYFNSELSVFLTAGTHKIRATATGSSGPNMDELGLFYASSADLNTPAAKHVEKNSFTSAVSELSSKAFPNPFTKSTTISYNLKESARTVLSVYTIQGQRVLSLVNATQNAGNYRVTFDAGKLFAGTYIYRLQTGKEVKTGKLIKK